MSMGTAKSAMALDAYVTTHPVVQHVNTVEEANQAFDAITYEKGEAVITMLEEFRRGRHLAGWHPRLYEAPCLWQYGDDRPVERRRSGRRVGPVHHRA